jgi:hypothetical protein
VDLGEPLTGAGTEDRAGGHLRRRQREAEVRRHQDDGRTAGLGAEALRRLDLRDPLAEGPDDPPAAARRPATITPRELTADFVVVPYVDRPGAPAYRRASFAIEDGVPGLHQTYDRPLDPAG